MDLVNERNDKIIFNLSLVIIVIAGILLSLFIAKGWKRCIPILISLLFVGLIVSIQHANYEQQLSFDYHQINQSTAVIDRDKGHLFHYRSKLIQMRNRLQYLSLTARYQNNSAHKKQINRKYRHLLAHYHKRYQHYKSLKKNQRYTLNEARRDVRKDHHKLHQLTVSHKA